MGTYMLSDLDGLLYGTVVNVRERFGFVKPDRRLPHPYNARKQIYFSADMTNMTEVFPGQRAVFKLNMNNTEKPAASKIITISSDIALYTMEPFYIRPECGHICSSMNGIQNDVCSKMCRKLIKCGHYAEDFCFVTSPEMCDECSGIQAAAQVLFSASQSEVFMGTSTYVGEGHGYIKPHSSILQEKIGKGGIYFSFDGATSAEVSSGQRVVFTQKLGRKGKPAASKMGLILKDLDGNAYIHEIQQVVVPWKPTTKFPSGDVNTVDKFEAQAADGTSNLMIIHILHPRRQVDISDPKDLNFRIAESHFLRLAQKAGKQYEIQSVEYCINPPLVRRFRAKSREFERLYGKGYQSKHVLAFHGTRQSNIDSIIKENFKLEFCQRNLYGKGIYLSEFPNVSLDFGKSLLLCKVLPGNSWDLNDCQRDGRIAHGYDSHRVKADKDGYGWALVVENPDQILPCYVIKYEAHDKKSTASTSGIRAASPIIHTASPRIHAASSSAHVCSPRHSQTTIPTWTSAQTYSSPRYEPKQRVEKKSDCIIL